MIVMEPYRSRERFSPQYDEIRRFLHLNADSGYNEHFPWGRLDWMMAHSMLDAERLPKIALFRDDGAALVGVALFDTAFQDRWYLLHTASDPSLLRRMVDYVLQADGDAAAIKCNQQDSALRGLLEATGFEQDWSDHVLALDLSRELRYRLPEGFRLTGPNEAVDSRQWRLVLHRGFENEGVPQEPGADILAAERHQDVPGYIRVFAMKDEEYVAHCGVFYDGGTTAYIEPVATVPEHRRKGLGRAVIYEAVGRAKMLGAKRAIVLSTQEFYLRLGMSLSSVVTTWKKG